MASCMAPNADGTCEAIAHYLEQRLDVPVTFVDDVPWVERERQLDRGEIQLCWLCGLPYIRKADAPAPAIELVAAPVMKAPRYADQAIYFSDVVVHAQSAFQAFDDLRGASWAYNEPNSHSGFNVVLHHLSRLNEREGYFGRAVESGAHQQSLTMIAAGDIDASAIDSTVLEAEFARSPLLATRVRVIGTLGPSPMPPWVMRRDLPSAFKRKLRHVFLAMHEDSHAQSILQSWNIARFAAVEDRHYEPIRHMAQQAQGLSLTAQP